MVMSYEIRYSDGVNKLVETLDDAHEILARKYADIVYSDDGGTVSFPYERELQKAGGILVWESESDAAGNARQNALAEIVKV
jgi:hypothetical protein